VSRASSDSCTAEGFSWSVDQTLVESWDGTAWSIVSSPNPSTAENTLGAVSCVGSTSCTAVGSSFQSLVEVGSPLSPTITNPPCGTGTGADNSDGTVTCTYSYTDGPQTFTVPAAVTEVQAVAIAGTGVGNLAVVGGSSTLGEAGVGAEALQALDVQPGEVLTIDVGGDGYEAIGWRNGGGAGVRGRGSSALPCSLKRRTLSPCPSPRWHLRAPSCGGASAACAEIQPKGSPMIITSDLYRVACVVRPKADGDSGRIRTSVPEDSGQG
jgi:hypothetical protein